MAPNSKSPATTLRIKRILVPLDESRHSAAALKVGIHWARQWQAELIGLHVEDLDLLNLASLPFSREIRSLPPAAQAIDRLQMERALRARAERCRQRLQELAEPAKLRWSFQVTRGNVAAEVLSLGKQSDLVIMGRAGHSAMGDQKLGTTALRVCSQSTCSVFLTRNGMDPMRPVLVFDGSSAATRALALASRLARVERSPLTVVLPVAEHQQAGELIHQLESRLEGGPLELHYLTLPQGLASLAQRIAPLTGAVVVMGVASESWMTEAGGTVLKQLPFPVILVR